MSHTRPIQPCSCGARGSNHLSSCVVAGEDYRGILDIKKQELDLLGPGACIDDWKPKLVIQVASQTEPSHQAKAPGLIYIQPLPTPFPGFRTQKEVDDQFGKGSEIASKLDEMGVFKTAEQKAEEAKARAEGFKRSVKEAERWSEGYEAGKQAAIDILVEYMRKTDDRHEIVLLAEVMVEVKAAGDNDD